MRAVFVDRDGTIIERVDELIDEKHVRILDSAVEGIQLLNALKLPVIMITNQPAVAWGLITEEGVQRINRFIVDEFGKRGARIDACYYCPHHPTKGKAPYVRECECRKPKAGMILKAAKDFNIDVKKSFMIGDWMTDVKTAKNAGCVSLLVNDEEEAKLATPDYLCRNFLEAAKIIKGLL